MDKNPRLLLAAVASFAIGIAADRIVMTFGETGPDSGEGEALFRAKKGAGSRATGSSRKATRSQAGADNNERRANGSRNQSRQEKEDRVPDSVRATLEALQRGGHIDARTANQLLKQAPAGRARREVLHRLAHHWARHNPEAAVAWANDLEGSDRRRALQEVLHGWSEEDPAGAANYVTQLPTSEQNLHLLHAMAYRWAERDQAAAMEWASAQTDPAKRERSMGGVVSSWSDAEPAAAAEFAASIESHYERHRVLEVAARRWASQDTTEAMEWAQGLPSADRLRATQSILREVAERDPELAATIYEDMTAAWPAEARVTRDSRRMAQEIASVWSSSSPQEAAEWAGQLPEAGEVRRSAVQNVAEHWLRIDSTAAGEWILELPEGSTRDAAAERVVGSTIRDDPALAFQWAGSLSDEGHSTGLMRDVLDRWKATDSVSAQAALGAANVSPEQRRELNELFGEVAPPQQPGPADEE
jgi:hypothetical protein